MGYPTELDTGLDNNIVGLSDTDVNLKNAVAELEGIVGITGSTVKTSYQYLVTRDLTITSAGALGFYGKAAIRKQTGVVKSATGIATALSALGLMSFA